MEFRPLLGVALGVVLLPQLSAAQAQQQGTTRACSTGACAWSRCSLPCAAALLVSPADGRRALPLRRLHGARRGQTVSRAAGLRRRPDGPDWRRSSHLVPPGRTCARRPVIAIAMLALTQLLNLVLVPRLGHAGLATVDRPGGAAQRAAAADRPGPARHLHGAARLVRVRRAVGTGHGACWPRAWPGPRGRSTGSRWRRRPAMRVGLLAATLAAAALVYFAALALLGISPAPVHSPRLKAQPAGSGLGGVSLHFRACPTCCASRFRRRSTTCDAGRRRRQPSLVEGGGQHRPRCAQPRLDVQTVLRRDRRARDASEAPRRGRRRAAAAPALLNRYFLPGPRLRGNVNHYHDPRNSYLHEVLRCARGFRSRWRCSASSSPWQIGLHARGSGFPGHFLIKLRLPGAASRASADRSRSPGARCRATNSPRCCSPAGATVACRGRTGAAGACSCKPASDRDVLACMLRNLKHHQNEGGLAGVAGSGASAGSCCCRATGTKRRDSGPAYAENGLQRRGPQPTWRVTSSTARRPTTRSRSTRGWLSCAARARPGAVSAAQRTWVATRRLAPVAR